MECQAYWLGLSNLSCVLTDKFEEIVDWCLEPIFGLCVIQITILVHRGV